MEGRWWQSDPRACLGYCLLHLQGLSRAWPICAAAAESLLKGAVFAVTPHGASLGAGWDELRGWQGCSPEPAVGSCSVPCPFKAFSFVHTAWNPFQLWASAIVRICKATFK